MKKKSMGVFCFAILALALSARAQTVVQIDADKVISKVSPTIYGLMTEEINYSYDGGLYAELIRNRHFKDVPGRGGRNGRAPATNPLTDKSPNLVDWWIVNSDGA